MQIQKSSQKVIGIITEETQNVRARAVILRLAYIIFDILDSLHMLLQIINDICTQTSICIMKGSVSLHNMHILL